VSPLSDEKSFDFEVFLMAELIATGNSPDHRWRRELPEGQSIRLGRAPRTGLSVTWDELISREHADLMLVDELLNVTCLGSAKNPIFVNGQSVREFTVKPGGHFQIGHTDFQFIDEVDSIPDEVDERAYEENELSSVHEGAQGAWQIVYEKLPSLIAKSTSTEDFAACILEHMLMAIPHAEAVAVMHFDLAKDPTLREPAMMLTQVRDDSMPFQPSHRLIRATIESRKNVLHMWNDVDTDTGDYTMIGNLDWAFCAPVNDRSCVGWCLYAAGSTAAGTANRDQLLADLRSTEVLAQFVGSISQVRLLEHQAAEISQYFSPTVVNAFRREKSQLEPREQHVTVLFCDVRGFSWRVDDSQRQLQTVFERVNDALGLMTRNIHKFEGAIADFQGDAALAFWGWPYVLEDGPLPACRAALAMLDEFNKSNEGNESVLDRFQVGIGIGHGPAIAGRMGSAEQVKVGVFGPVVNLTSRLEGMTKHFRVPIIMNDATAQIVQRDMGRDEARCRKLAKVRPMGMRNATLISELLPGADAPNTVSDENIAKHEVAVDAFIAGDWMRAFDIFAAMSAADRAKDYLMWYMAQHQFEAPDDWDGVLEFTMK